jgi:hypothetical protein
VSAIHRSLTTAERRLHIEPTDVQLNGKAAVTERPAARFRQKVAEGSAQVVYQRISRGAQRVYASRAIR